MKFSNIIFKVIDSCIGVYCNLICFDKLIFVDVGEVWYDVIKVVIIIFFLVIIVFCFGLKVSFMVYYCYLMKR